MTDYLSEELAHFFELTQTVRSGLHTAHMFADGLLHGIMGGLHGKIIMDE